MSEKAKPRPKAKPESAPSVELIVKRGASDRFKKLKKKTANLPVQVAWDPRLEERRGASDEAEVDRRTGDRRQNVPYTWEVGDFVLVIRPPR